jgi:Ser/Thr protein kinase RdoA (MazF antagonist)
MVAKPEEHLQSSDHRPIVRIDDTVRRPAGWWTPAVQTLLRHLHDVGFPYAPEPGGIDAEGREVVSYIAGESGATGWYRIHSEQGLRRFAIVLREFHEAITDFRPNDDLEWAVGPSEPRELVCHNDFGPWNLVYDGDNPVGIIDWDLAAPGPRINDIAYALEYAVPFRDDVRARSWHHFAEPPDRRSRLEAFAEAYGLASTDDLVDAVIDRQRLTIVHVEELAARGIEPQASWVVDGTLEESRRLVAWTEDNRSSFA